MWIRPMVLFFAMAAYAAEDGWEKVKALASGAELRITKAGGKAPILATMDQATDESLIVATKTEQISIAKSEIVKVESRPAQKSSRVVKQSTVNQTPVDTEATRPRPGPTRTPGPAGSASSGISIGGKPDFELVWAKGRRN
jgi:hypothetical protein